MPYSIPFILDQSILVVNAILALVMVFKKTKPFTSSLITSFFLLTMPIHPWLLNMEDLMDTVGWVLYSFLMVSVIMVHIANLYGLKEEK